MAKATKIDEVSGGVHRHIQNDEEVWFLFEYTMHRDYRYGTTNSFISNLKKPVSKKHEAQYYYKEQAIREATGYLTSLISPEWLQTGTIVPVPPSKAKDHPEYDDRLLQILGNIPGKGANCVRELVVQAESKQSDHTNAGNRSSIQELKDNYRINYEGIEAQPSSIMIFDDVLTTGAHYRAMKEFLEEHFPGVPIMGLFLARSVPPPDEM